MEAQEQVMGLVELELLVLRSPIGIMFAMDYLLEPNKNVVVVVELLLFLLDNE
jgi:hypothetical protein